jgi:hypothetical protein
MSLSDTVRRLRLSTVGSLSILMALGVMLLSPLRLAAQDPAGIATGDKSNVVDAGGNSFVVAEPMDKSAPDYADKKKAYDEYKAQTEKEPLAMKLADSVGHVRIATNFAWTLNTGYLVRTYPQKECRASDDVELCGLRVRLYCVLGRGLRISVWRGGGQRGAWESGRSAQPE